MAKNILIIIGHPDPYAGRYGRVLARAYAAGAQSAGHHVTTVDVARLEFPLLRTKADFEMDAPPNSLKEARAAIEAAQHIVLIFPLWLGEMPALFKGFLEQVLVGAFKKGAQQPLKGKSARIVITMGMPALLYRLVFGAHGLKNLKRNILGFCGMRTIRTSLIGLIESPQPKARGHWLHKVELFGRAGI